jgi:hypothetical protein
VTAKLKNELLKIYEEAREIARRPDWDELRARIRSMKTSELLTRLSESAAEQTLSAMNLKSREDAEQALLGLWVGLHIIAAEIDRRIPVPETCDHRDAHDLATDTPTGNRCGEPATHRIEWADGRYSFGCDAHLTIDDAATVKPARIFKLSDLR